MAIFSNFDGTMKKKLQIGKKGLKIVNKQNKQIYFLDHNEGSLIPINVAEPFESSHAVTLEYFNKHKGDMGGVPNTFYGTDLPEQNMGINGDIYYRLDEFNVYDIYVKDEGIWKPFRTSFETDFTSSYFINSTDFNPNGDGSWSVVVKHQAHKRTGDLILQIQSSTRGAVYDADILISSENDIEITILNKPIDTNLLIIGDTNMQKAYSTIVSQDEWKRNIVTGKYEFTIFAKDHKLDSSALMLAFYEYISNSEYELKMSTVGTRIDTVGNVTFIIEDPVRSKLVINGK